jgi:hypothetical protein
VKCVPIAIGISRSVKVLKLRLRKELRVLYDKQETFITLTQFYQDAGWDNTANIITVNPEGNRTKGAILNFTCISGQ